MRGGNGAIGRMRARVHVQMYGCIHLSGSGSYLRVFVLVHHLSAVSPQGTTARAVWPTSPSPLARLAVSTATWSAGLGWRLRRPTVRTLSPAPTCLPVTPSTHSDKVQHHGAFFRPQRWGLDFGWMWEDSGVYTVSKHGGTGVTWPCIGRVDKQERL